MIPPWRETGNKWGVLGTRKTMGILWHHRVGGNRSSYEYIGWESKTAARHLLLSSVTHFAGERYISVDRDISGAFFLIYCGYVWILERKLYESFSIYNDKLSRDHETIKFRYPNFIKRLVKTYSC